jgi:multiple sugar transport system substrate-binding protein
MKKFLYVLLILAFLTTAAACTPAAPAQPAAGSQPTQAPTAAGPVTLHALFMKQAGYQESDIDAITKEFMDKNPNIKIETEYVTYEALHDKIVTAAAAKAGTYDVVLIDCIWPAEFAAANFVMDVSDRITPDMRKDIWTGALQAVTYKDHMYAMPWLNDVLYLYYNEDMLKAAGYDAPPKTWTELNTMAMAAKQKNVVQYPFIEYFQQDEGLTIAYAYYLMAFGGKFFDENNNPAFNTSEGKAALDYMVNGMKSGMYNPASMESTYEEVRRAFEQGNAMFSVNWTYQYNMANDAKDSQIAGKAKIALMPGEKGPSVTINGGMGLSIMADSKNPDQAWQYILYLSSKDVQKHYANSALPIWMSLFSDPDLVKGQPVMVPISQEQYKYIQNRPIIPFYSEASKIMSRELQLAISGKETSDQALKTAEEDIQKVHEKYK